MRALLAFSSLAVNLLVAPLSNAAELSYPVSLPTPKVESLQTSLSPTGGTVNVQLQVQYDLAGIAYFSGTVDGAGVSGKATVKTSATGTTYKFSVRSATVPATVLSISGALGTNTASCGYSGPKGRTNVLANPVTIGVVQPVPATMHLDPVINYKNVVGGTSRLEAGYTTNPIVAGTLKGKVTTNGVSLAIKQGKRSATFTGKRMDNAYVGTLRLTIPPGRLTITNFSIPLTDVSVAAGPALFRGSLVILSNQLPTPAAGTKVTIRSDVNADGKFTGRDVVKAVADEMGRYQISATVMRGRPVMLEIRRPGFAEILQSYASVKPGTMLTWSAMLHPLDDLEVSAGSAESTDGSIRLDGLPANIESVQARVFNPATEAKQFPGQFADSQGNLLVSSVFAAIEASDAAGRPVTNVGNSATLCMRVPVESWARLGDLVPANGQIDVPLYYYDESDGQWKRNPSDGWLEDVSRAKISEDQLAAIRSASYTGDVFAAGPITHLSWWNIDWPVSTRTRVKGVIVDPNGMPVTGAAVSAFGLTYTGTSGPDTTGPDGLFCFEVMRSELAGEDVDGNGVPGETQQVHVKVQYGANVYSLGSFSSPTSAATCTNGTGLNVGLLMLNDVNRLTVSNCPVTGRVVYSGISMNGTPGFPAGNGVRNAKVVGFDPDALEAAATSCSNCLVTTTDSLGYFSLNVPVLSGVSLNTFAILHNFSTNSPGYGVFLGSASMAGCPPEPVTLEADYFHIGLIPLTLYQGANVWGTATIFVDDSMRVVSRLFGSIYYIGGRASVGLPFQTGPWAVVPMRNSTPGTGIGQMYFNVTSVFPPAGTWEIKDGSVHASGTWRLAIDIP